MFLFLCLFCPAVVFCRFSALYLSCNWPWTYKEPAHNINKDGWSHMSKAAWLTTDPSATKTLTGLRIFFSVPQLRPLVLSITAALKQSVAHPTSPFFSYMLTGYLTTGDFVRLTNRPPFPSLMSFEHFIAIWPAVLEPQREWSMMETPYKKKINQTHFNSNIVREGTVAWMWDVKDNTSDTRGGGGVKIHYEFLWRKKLLTFSFPRPVRVIRPLTPLLPLAPCVVCLMSCSVASRLQGLALQVGVISLLATAVKRKTVESSFSLHTPTPTQRLWL